MSQFLVAYVDPGSGAMLVQAILASIVGAGTWFTTKFFRRQKEDKGPSHPLPPALEREETVSLKSKTQLLREFKQ